MDACIRIVLAWEKTVQAGRTTNKHVLLNAKPLKESQLWSVSGKSVKHSSRNVEMFPIYIAWFIHRTDMAIFAHHRPKMSPKGP